VLLEKPIKGMDGHGVNGNGRFEEKNMGDELADAAYKMPVAVKVAFVEGHDLSQVSPSRILKKNVLVLILHESSVSMGI
jgi:hypothetical protein